MKEKLLSTARWLPHYCFRQMMGLIPGQRRRPKHLYFCICDHFEPYWNSADHKTARRRIQRWLTEYPKIAAMHKDSDGALLKYSFFYPAEEYRKEDLDALAELCNAGYGEVEIHLHHDNDTAHGLYRTLLDYKRRLHEEHGLLCRNRHSGEICYGFIHGNWALNNCRTDGRWCGVNNETEILLQTGCYADFTMPSAPSQTQTRKINSIYYALPSTQANGHNDGVDAEVGVEGKGLLMVQGPLCPSFHRRKYGLIPRIENSGLKAGVRVDERRVGDWVAPAVQVHGAPDHVFIKLYTHGTQENIMRSFFDDEQLTATLQAVRDHSAKHGQMLHFTSAREMANVIRSLEQRRQEPASVMKDLYLIR